MAYWSNAGLVLSPEAYNSLQGLEESKDFVMYLLEDANEHKEKNGAHYYRWNRIAWNDIIELENFLYGLDCHDYKFVRLGEEDDDIETMGIYCDNFSLSYKKDLYLEEDE